MIAESVKKGDFLTRARHVLQHVSTCTRPVREIRHQRRRAVRIVLHFSFLSDIFPVISLCLILAFSFLYFSLILYLFFLKMQKKRFQMLTDHLRFARRHSIENMPSSPCDPSREAEYIPFCIICATANIRKSIVSHSHSACCTVCTYTWQISQRPTRHPAYHPFSFVSFKCIPSRGFVVTAPEMWIV